ncbi:MAG: heavy metal-associated domain-containing protein [Desulfoplanes sp.]
MDKTTINVQGMSCQHCVQSVTRALQNIEGLQEISVDLAHKTASFTSDSPVNMDAVHAAIRNIGFETTE